MRGCKGPSSHNICPTVQFNNGTNFPQKSRHGCIACSEPNFWDEKTPFWKIEERYTPQRIASSAIFEKDVSNMVVGVLPYTKNPNLRPKAGKVETKTYNALGRRVKSPVKNNNRKMQKQPRARGMFFEKTKDKVRKVLEI